jgi:hypothetical protein
VSVVYKRIFVIFANKHSLASFVVRLAPEGSRCRAVCLYINSLLGQDRRIVSREGTCNL